MSIGVGFCRKIFVFGMLEKFVRGVVVDGELFDGLIDGNFEIK